MIKTHNCGICKIRNALIFTKEENAIELYVTNNDNTLIDLSGSVIMGNIKHVSRGISTKIGGFKKRSKVSTFIKWSVVLFKYVFFK